MSTGGLFEAGGNMGKAAPEGGWYHYFKVPFYESVRVQTRAPNGSGCIGGYMIVRGYEVAPGSGLEAGFPLASGFVVPAGARLELQVRRRKIERCRVTA